MLKLKKLVESLEGLAQFLDELSDSKIVSVNQAINLYSKSNEAAFAANALRDLLEYLER